MKRFLRLFCILVLTVSFSLNLFSQNKSVPNQPNANLLAADKYFNNFEYYLAAKKYEKVIKKDSSSAYALYQLAECYRFYYDYKGAESIYHKVYLKHKKEYPLAHYWYASMLKDNGNYLKALYHFEKFRKDNLNTSLEVELYREKAQFEIKGCYVIMDEVSNPKKNFGMECMPKPINSEESEYSPVIIINDSSLVVTSSRKGASGKIKNTSLGGASSDVYKFEKKEDKDWEQVKIETDNFSKLNTPYNECSGSFTKDGKRYYFTRCDLMVKTDNIEEITCGIYVSYLKDGMWGAPVLLNKNINPPGQWNGQPSISHDGNILFFASKRPGGIGMHDLWYSTCNGTDNWGPATNLGEHVNTLFTDVSPRYYADQKVLFFSSNGHGGLGGLDIFMAKEDESFENIVNLGMPFNSPRDDFYFVLGEKKGYISSNRQNGIGNDDIYSFKIKDRKNMIRYFIDSTETPDEHQNIILAENDKPITNKAVIASIDNADLSNAKSITVDGKIVIQETKKPVEDLTILLVDEIGTTLKTAKTDKKGYYKFSNLEGGVKYKLIFQQSSLAEKMDNNNYLSEKVNITGSETAASKQFFENIFFDFDSYELRPEAKKVLDELVQFCKGDSILQIELYANTDSYGSSQYNKNLAAKRGKTAMEYLVKNGLPQSSIVINSVGENKSIATNDTELGRQLNRRIEFYVLGASSLQYGNMTYVIESNKTVYSLAKEYNMTEEELVELNGLTSNEINAFTPVRIKKRIELNEFGAPNTHLHNYAALNDTLYTEAEEKGVKKNQEINKNFNFKNPEYLKYVDSIAAHTKYKPLQNENLAYYTVQSKNTIQGIARLYGIDVEKLKTLNNLTNESLFIGQKIIIDFRLKNPSITGYVVKDGDTVESLAKRFEVSLAGFIQLNQLEGYTLQKNMILRLK